MSSAVKKGTLAKLAPYLIGDRPREDGEWDMYCPLHEDRKRSAQLNVENGVWYCHAGCGGGRVMDLIRRRSEWVPPAAAALNGHSKRELDPDDRTPLKIEPLSEAKIKGWNVALMADEGRLDALMSARGLHLKTVATYDIGWDDVQMAYTIPIRDTDGTLTNIRRYQLHPPRGRRKIWGVEGHNRPTLYPTQVLAEDHAEVVVCEGEMDALITTQHGFPAITRTGAAKVWKSEWSELFKGKRVYICHDCDTTGQGANVRAARSLARHAAEVRIIRLPYPIEEKHGRDLTDWWMEHDGDNAAFRRLMDEAPVFGSGEEEETETLDPSDASVLDSFDARKVGKPLRLTLTVKGKRDPGYSVPRKARFTCSQDAGVKCNACPLFGSGDDERVVAGADPVVLELMDSTRIQINDILRRSAGIVKCNRLNVEVSEHQSVEVLFARPSVDHVNGHRHDDFKNVKLTSVGRHDTATNNTVNVVGALHPDPRRQLNEFLVWDVTRMESSLDRFEVTEDVIKKLRKFRPRPTQRPLKKLGQIARDLSDHVTRIYGRPEMHAAMDLTFHSAITFDFAGKRLARGWIELLVVGDTRTGKSEAATRLSEHFNAGEIVSCESATFAGIVGGLQQYGASKEWAITWGAIPINDRRLVVLDEVGGLEPEDIAKLSSVRSSGIAELTKIQQERTLARTRLIWLGNPRNARMSDYTYGVQAIRPLIGNNEDIARFDLAMSVRAGDVPAEEINRVHDESEQRFDAQSCNMLLRWAWSRTPEQITWAEGAEAAVFKAATELGSRYVDDPPLIQAANAREKVARVAVALALRLFSTDDGETVIVRIEHVEDAVSFIDRIYNLTGFGYAERSRDILSDQAVAEERAPQMKSYLYDRKDLAKFLRANGKFRRQDVEEVLNVERDEATGVINTLLKNRMVRKDKGDIRVEPTLHNVLREMNL